MKMVTRKQINRGFYGFQDDSADFLRPDGPAGTDPYKAEGHSSVGYNASKNDNAGTRDYAGHGDDSFRQDWRDGSVSDQNEAYLRPSYTGDTDYVHGSLYGLIDGQEDLPAHKQLTGGGPVSDNKYGGVGSGPPTHRPKNVGHAGQMDRSSRGGVTNVGLRGR